RKENPALRQIARQGITGRNAEVAEQVVVAGPADANIDRLAIVAVHAPHAEKPSEDDSALRHLAQLVNGSRSRLRREVIRAIRRAQNARADGLESGEGGLGPTPCYSSHERELLPEKGGAEA